MSDIVERLRWTITADTPARYPDIVSEAADTIERLRVDLKNAVWSDSEECNLLTAENDKLWTALMWIEDQDPQIVDQAREKFALAQHNTKG